MIYFILCNKGLVIKLYSGGLFDYSGINEIAFYLNILGVPFATLPSVGILDTAFSYLGLGFDLLVNRNIIITRITKRSLINSKFICEQTLAESQPIIVAYLSIRLVPYLCKILSWTFGKYCPILCVYKSS